MNSRILYTLCFWCASLCGGLHAQQGAFIENKGQWPSQVTHKLELTNGQFWLEQGGWSMSVFNSNQKEEALHVLHGEDGSSLVDGHVLKARLVRSNARPTVQGFSPLKAYHNYIIGSDSSKWKGHVALYEEVLHKNVYQGIDLRVTQDGGWPKMTYEVAPNRSPHSISILYEGHRGLSIDGNNLQIKTSVGTIEETGLLAYQLIENQQVKVRCRFVVKDGLVGFKLGKYDPNHKLFIDPTVIASTNSGCTSEAFGHTATFNENGQIYSGGRCFGTGYPTDTGAFQVDFGGPFTGNYYLKVDMCLSKYNAIGSDLIYATYLGGNAEDLPHSMIVNDSDQVILLGSTNSTNYPVLNSSYDPSHNGGKDIVVTILTSDGSALVGSTYIGGANADGVNNLEEYYADAYRGEVILGGGGEVYVASFSRSPNFPTTAGVAQDTNSGQQDGVVCKLSRNVDTLLWSTYLGGSGRDAAFALKVDDSSNVYVSGVTASSDFPVLSTGANPTYLGGGTDAFMIKLDSIGQTILAGSFFGTANGDQNYFVELDETGGIYFFGTSTGTVSATTGKYAGPGSGGYVYKTNWNLDTIQWVSSFGDLAPAAFLVDNCSRIYISGQGATAGVLNLANFDTLEPVNSLTQAGFYLMKLSPDAESLEFGSFYGNNGSHVDGGTSRFDKRGVVYQATCSNGVFPTTNWAYSTTNQTNNATYDNTVFKIDFESNVAKALIVPGDTACAPYEAEFSNNGSVGTVHFWDFGDGSTSTDSMPTHYYDSVGLYEILYVITDSAGCYGDDSTVLTLNLVAPVIPSIIVGDTDCVDSVSLKVDTSLFVGYTWSTGQIEPEIHVYAEGQYAITTTANLFCENADTIEVTFQENYHFDLQDTGFCELDQSVSGPGDAIYYAWSTGDSTQSITIPKSGVYTLTASNGECETADSMMVDVSIANFSTQDTTLCLDSFPLVVDHGGGDILWSTNETTHRIAIWKSGTYWVTVSNEYCESTDTINVEFHPELVDLGSDTVVCEGFELTLNEDFDAILWGDGSLGNSVFVDSSSTVYLKVGIGNCIDEDTLKVEVQDLTFSGDTFKFCDADSGLIEGPLLPNADYLWSNGDSVSSSWVYGSGVYILRVQTAHCLEQDTTYAHFVTTPSFSLGPDTSMCFGETLSIPLDNQYDNPVWSTGDSASAIVLETAGEFWASQYYQGCIRYDTIQIGLRKLMSDTFSMINNVMTPNGDGINDDLAFHVEEPSLILDYHLYVYDRWGIQVFESEDMYAKWDGIRPSGKPAGEGAYFYILDLETVCTQRPVIEVKDNVTLLK